MKKFKNLILSLVFILFNTVMYAQLYMHAVSSQVANWSHSKQDWDWQKLQSTYISIKFKGRLIEVSDQAKSFYITYDVISDDGETVVWEAQDEGNRDCRVMMTMLKNETYLIIIYPEVCFRYKTVND